MSGTKSSRGQSSKSFFHWLKNTWLGRLWNWIVSWFRPEQKETEPKLTPYRQIQDEQNGQFQSHEVGQDLNLSREGLLSNLNKSRPRRTKKVPSTRAPNSSSSQDGEEIPEDTQKRNNNSYQAPINPKSPTMSRSSSEPCLDRTALSESLTNSRNRSQSLNDLLQTSIDSELEWDDSDLNPISSQPEQKGARGVQRKNVGTYNFKYDDCSQKSVLLNPSSSSTLSNGQGY